MPTNERITFALYAPVLTFDDRRPMDLVRTLEALLPGLELVYVISPAGAVSRVDDRDGLLQRAAARGELPLLCNGDETLPLTVSGRPVPAAIGPGRAPLLDTTIKIPARPPFLDRADEILLAAGEVLAAHWGVASPRAAAVHIGAQIVFPHLPGQPPPGLPAQRPAQDLPSALVPQRLGWINYWSAETAALLEFPDPARDAELVSGARRGKGGGWTVRLTGTPLDLEDGGDLAALQRAYARFPPIGGRFLG